MAQTAVEFLLENIHLLHSLKWNDVIEQAKQMEKEQIVVTFYEGMKTNTFDPNMGRGIMYYNQTYNK